MMDLSKKRRPVRAFLIFLAGMALITYFSRALYIYSLPHVEVSYLTSGRLYTELEPTSFAIESDQMEWIGLSIDLSSTPLYVSSVQVEQCSAVNAGEALIAFDQAQGALVLKQATEAVQEARAALNAWDAAWEAELAEAERKLDEDIANLPAAEDIDRTAAELRGRRGELLARRESGFSENAERLQLVYALNEAEQREEALRTLEANGWVVCAQKQCTVVEVMIRVGDLYSGALPLCTVVPAGAPIRVGFAVSDAPEEEDTASISLQFRGKDLPGWTYDAWRTEGTGAAVWFSADAEVTLEQLNGAALLFTSNRYQYLVPNSAIDGGSVYVLRSRDAAFGGQEDYALQVQLGRAPTDGQNTAVLNGLSGTDLVIIKWDRSFGNGDAVAAQNP